MLRESRRNPYRAQWDEYISRWDPTEIGDGSLPKGSWPGDEWGTRRNWDQVFRTMFLNFGAHSWRHCVEIGAGSGKYTRLLLEHTAADIIACDISPRFLDALTQRLASEVKAGRVIPVLLEGITSSEILDYLDDRRLTGQIDAFYSIDAMVHVTLQHLITYLLTAAVCLRKDGMVLLTIPNATSEKGFATLLTDAKRCYREQSDPSIPRFEWLCPELVTDVFARLGFETQFVLPFGGSMSEYRDLHIAATLTDLSQVQRFRNAIASHG